MITATHGIVQSNYSKIVKDGLVFWVDAMNDNSYPETGIRLVDLSGNNNNVTLVNGPTFDTVNGGSIVFDGTNDLATASNATSINSFTTGMTINVWTKINAGFVNFDGIITKTNGTGTNGWAFFYNNNNVRFYVNSTATAATSSFTTADTTPVNWTCIYNGANVILYKNGILNNVGASLTASVSNSGGTMQFAPNLPANLYTVQIYNKALSANEVSQNYNATRTRFGL